MQLLVIVVLLVATEAEQIIDVLVLLFFLLLLGLCLLWLLLHVIIRWLHGFINVLHSCGMEEAEGDEEKVNQDAHIVSSSWATAAYSTWHVVLHATSPGAWNFDYAKPSGAIIPSPADPPKLTAKSLRLLLLLTHYPPLCPPAIARRESKEQ